MDLVIASHDLYPDSGSGGTGRYVYETARRLATRGHTVAVITRRRGDEPLRQRLAGFEVFRYDVSIAGDPVTRILPRMPAAVTAVANVAERLDPDVVSFQGPVTSLFLHGCVDGSVPRSCTFHSPWPSEYWLRTTLDHTPTWRRWLNVGVRARLEGFLLDRVDEVVTLSDYMRGQLMDRYAPAVPAVVVPGGVDTERFTPTAGRSDHLDPDGFTFLTVRRLTPRMGHERLLEAFASVRQERPDVELYLAGDGSMRDWLRARAAALGIEESTTFLGYVPDDDLPALYASADLFVLPTSELEGFGLATLEALSAGTPVVATPVGGTVELLQGVQSSRGMPSEMLVADTSPESLAERMLTWATLPEALRSQAGRITRRHVERRYPWSRTADALEQRYRALASQ